MISDPQSAGRAWWVTGILLVTVFITYVGTYAILRITKVFVRMEWGYESQEKVVWHSHAIETAGAVKDPTRRNVALWIVFWPVHRSETAVRNVFQPRYGEFP